MEWFPLGFNFLWVFVISDLRNRVLFFSLTMRWQAQNMGTVSVGCYHKSFALLRVCT